MLCIIRSNQLLKQLLQYLVKFIQIFVASFNEKLTTLQVIDPEGCFALKSGCLNLTACHMNILLSLISLCGS